MTTPTRTVDPAASALGRKGGQARAKLMTPKQRQASASHAANARWSRVRAAARKNRRGRSK